MALSSVSVVANSLRLKRRRIGDECEHDEPVETEEKMKKEFIVDGIDSNIDFQLRLIKNKDFEAGTYDNTFLEKFLADSKNDKDNGK